jgi:uncharacterized membrane protein
MCMKKKISLYGMAALYLLAGFNHFISPQSYTEMIPVWLGNAALINGMAGIAELVLALLLFFKPAQKWACFGIILMLLAFIPAHIRMIENGIGINGEAVPAWILWLRLILLQPLLIWWGWTNRK